MGEYQTNCYIVSINNKDFIIDPGVGATSWVKQNVTNPIAILNTHGHFDHIWSVEELKNDLGLKVYCPKDDAFMLLNDPLGRGAPSCEVDDQIQPDEQITLSDIKITFHHFPGHTPGCSAIEIENQLFTGDFIFNNSIGRVDFPYSNPQDMVESIKKVLKWDRDIEIHPGHGVSTSLKRELTSLNNWLNYL